MNKEEQQLVNIIGFNILIEKQSNLKRILSLINISLKNILICRLENNYLFKNSYWLISMHINKHISTNLLNID